MHPVIPLLEASKEDVFNTIGDQLATQGYFHQTNILPKKWVKNLRQFALEKGEEGAFKTAGIGKLNTFNVDKNIRGDSILWVDEQAHNEYILEIEEFLDQLKTHLNRTCFLGLRDKEMHLAKYAPGTFYKRHADRFNQQSHRHISFVFYLNPKWEKANGGELAIYLPTGESVLIEPKAGTLIMFRSELEHEVLMAHKPRYSLTGWLLDIDKKLTFL